MPRRARHLIPATLQRRAELLAACATAIVLAHLLLAQLTLVLAGVFVVVGRTSRWRLWWLLCPALAGLAWILVAGPGNAFAGFAAGPADVLRYLSGRELSSGHLFERLGHPLEHVRVVRADLTQVTQQFVGEGGGVGVPHERGKAFQFGWPLRQFV